MLHRRLVIDPPFTPAMLPWLHAWYEARDVYVSPVSSWTDRGLRGSPVIQATSSYRPTLSNGAVVFDSTNDALYTSTLPVTINDISVWIVSAATVGGVAAGNSGWVCFAPDLTGMDSQTGLRITSEGVIPQSGVSIRNRGAKTQYRLNEYRIKSNVIENYYDGVLIESLSCTPNGACSAMAIGGVIFTSVFGGANIKVKSVVVSKASTPSQRALMQAYFNAGQNRVRTIFVGDSLTDSLWTGTLVNQGEDHPDVYQSTAGRENEFVVNYGIYGTNIAGMKNPDLTVSSTARLVIYIGSNDCSAGSSSATILSGIASYISARVSAGWTANNIYVCTVTPRTDVTGAKETVRTDVNAGLRSTYGARCIDFAADSRLANASDLTYYKSDGIHHNAAGCAVKAALVHAVLP